MQQDEAIGQLWCFCVEGLVGVKTKLRQGQISTRLVFPHVSMSESVREGDVSGASNAADLHCENDIIKEYVFWCK